MNYHNIKRIILIFNIVFFNILISSFAQDTLKIDEAIQLGLENNFDIKISKGQQEIASNNNTLGNAGFLPTLDLSASQRYTKENTSLKFFNGTEQSRDGAKSNNLAESAVINWTIFDGTTMFQTKNRLEEQEKMAFAQNDAVIQNTVAQIGFEFYTVALEQIRLDLFRENISLSEDRLEIAKNKFEFGKVAKTEFLQAQVDLNNDKSNYLLQQQRLATSKTALNELLARDVTLDFFVEFDPELNTSLDYEELQTSMQSSNPELIASLYDMNATRLVEKEIKGERLPIIGLNGGYNYAKSEAEAGQLLSRKSTGFNYGISASWQLFNGFNVNRRVQNAKILAENSSLNYEAIKLNLDKALYSTFINYQNNIQLHKMEEQNREVAQENNEIAMERYRVGTSSPLELRQAQINLLEANLRFLNAAYSIKTSEIDLLMLSGKILK
jgi:outer membrane protein TolC